MNDDAGSPPKTEAADRRLRAVLHNAPVAMAMATGGGDLIDVNAELCALLDVTPEALRGRTLVEFTHLEDVAAATKACSELRQAGGRSSLPVRFMRPSGDVRHVVVHSSLVAEPHEHPEFIVFSVEEVVEERFTLLRTDGLTGLLSREPLMHLLDRAVRRQSQPDPCDLALMFVDVDGLKALNDGYGHAAGDAALRLISSALSTAVRPGDTVARIGGDEFVVLCDGVDHVEAAEIATRLTDAVSDASAASDLLIEFSISTGVAVAAGAALDSAEQLLAVADAAMYAAKRGGPGRWLVRDVPDVPPRH